MPTFILAAGESVRFGADYPKQHIEINGERLIDRIIRGFEDDRPFVVTHRDDIAPNYKRRFSPGGRRYTAETVLFTKHQWGMDNTFLFSDVLFTDLAIEQIKDCKLPIAFFTDGHDIFGFRFMASMNRKMTEALRHVVENADKPEGNLGRIWEVYRFIFGWGEWPFKPAANPTAMVFMGDATQDFDKVEEVEMFHNGISKNVIMNPDWKDEP